MRKDLAIIPIEFNSSFQSCKKDMKTILEKLFTQSNPYSEDLKRLLIINTKDCLDRSNQKYNDKIKKYSLGKLKEEGYIRNKPILSFGEHEPVKAYIIINFDNFTPNATNPQFRDCTISFDILCDTNYYELDDFDTRPAAIMGVIDGILHGSKLSGIGTLQFAGAQQLILSEDIAGYTMMYLAIHGSDDRILPEEIE